MLKPVKTILHNANNLFYVMFHIGYIYIYIWPPLNPTNAF